ncbi:hypothetical protein LSG31_01740 [Fodinisporobacter ferrooxydans]|uniref:Uncharacterized protein n=1 Tax=Fodinisporobacter ferrooxydans TaxID=2901836 RepID=A0ABY4CKU0_9BACL|nr:hypothetical protein LSG31_01740 [Alicyclobacillaceae bacterium MYW30-H2]
MGLLNESKVKTRPTIFWYWKYIGVLFKGLEEFLESIALKLEELSTKYWISTKLKGLGVVFRPVFLMITLCTSSL